ncbi:MAG: PEP-CTERM sorting domain-containing protein [Deltaproteobacteria bacterium]|nr:PEP-CTERM sorting domain-containing protein [Deltaproteobacteria bacterium]
MRIKKIFMLFLCIVLAIIFLPYNISAYEIVIDTYDLDVADGSTTSGTIIITDLTVAGDYGVDIYFTEYTEIVRSGNFDGLNFLTLDPYPAYSPDVSLCIELDGDTPVITVLQMIGDDNNGYMRELFFSDELGWPSISDDNNFAYYDDVESVAVDWTTQPIPEPATMLLLGSGLLGLAGFRKRFRKR